MRVMKRKYRSKLARNHEGKTVRCCSSVKMSTEKMNIMTAKKVWSGLCREEYENLKDLRNRKKSHERTNVWRGKHTAEVL
jgi:hypothetical protein